jgi:hypothetical protein
MPSIYGFLTEWHFIEILQQCQNLDAFALGYECAKEMVFLSCFVGKIMSRFPEHLKY